MGKYSFFSVAWLATSCVVAIAAGNETIVVRRDFDVDERWSPKRLCGREFYVSFTYHEWLDPESKNPKPDLELYRESGIRLTGGKSTDWKAIERDGKTYAKFMEKPQIKSPLTAAELIGPMVPYYAKRFEGGNRPIFINPFCHRPAFFLEPEYDLDIESYRSWAAKHPNLIGIMELAEFDSDAYTYEVLFNTITDEKLKARLNLEFTPPKNQYEWLDFAQRCVERTKSVMFGEKRLWTMNSSNYTLSHIMASLGACGVIYEATSQEMGRWQTAGAFMRGTARQWDIPFAWYIANWTTGFTRDGKMTNGENCWTEDYRDKSKSMSYYSPRAPHLGSGRSAIARQSAHGYLAGASFEEPENWIWTHRAPGTDSKGRPNVSDIARDLDGLYRLSKRVDRGAVYTPCAILTPLSERYGVKGETLQIGFPLEQNAFFFTLAPVRSEDIRHRSLRKAGNQSCLFNSEFGEFYDVLVPDARQDTREFQKALSAYKCAFLIGNYRKIDLDADALTRYVENGGTLFFGADKVTNGVVSAALAGLRFTGETVRSGKPITDDRGKTFDTEGEYEYLKALAATAEPLMKDADDNVVAYANKVGKGKMITVTAAGMIPCDLRQSKGFDELLAGRLNCRIVGYLLRRVQAEMLPVRVKGDIQWGLNRAKDGAWVLWLINNKGVTKFSFEPEEFDPARTAKVSARFVFPVASASDLRADKPLAVEDDVISVEVDPGEWKMIRITEAK